MMSTPALSNRNRSQWDQPAYWAKLCPKLTIHEPASSSSPSSSSSSPPPLTPPPPTPVSADEAKRRRKCLLDEGYVRVNTALPPPLIQKLRKGVESLVEAGYPASFIFLFDEAWTLAKHSQRTLKQSCHPSNKLNFDCLAWYIYDSAGFSPHRDRQPDNVKDSFHAKDDAHDEDDDNDDSDCSGDAKFVTHWIALSDATPENSCLYMIPKSQDPGYLEGDPEDDDDNDDNGQDPLRRALARKQDYQSIRALPRDAGTSLMFTHRVIHWGSSRDATTDLPPRVAISFVCSDPSYEPCYLVNYQVDKSSTGNNNNDSPPPFSIRLLLVCAQLLIYYQRFDLPLETIQACYQYCKENEQELEKTYRQKVYLEYVKALKEERKRKDNSDTKVKEGGLDKEVYDDDDEEAEEAMLEEMLNAEEEGYGEFEDDFDEEMEEEIQAEEAKILDHEEREMAALELADQNPSRSRKKAKKS